MSCLITKPTKWHVRPAKTLISLGICPVWSESSLCAQWVAKDPRCCHADSEDSDQTGRMPRLFWVVAGGTDHFVGFVMRRLKPVIILARLPDFDMITDLRNLSKIKFVIMESFLFTNQKHNLTVHCTQAIEICILNNNMQAWNKAFGNLIVNNVPHNFAF